MMRAGAHFGALPIARRRRPRRASVAEVISAPCACASTSLASGMVGSIQCRSRPTSMSRPSSRAISNQSTNSSLTLAGFQRLQHRHPGRQDDACRAGPVRAPPLRCGRADKAPAPPLLSSICLRSRLCASRISGSAMRFRPSAEIAAPPRCSLFAERMGFGFQRIERVACPRCAPAHGCRPPPEKLRPGPRGLPQRAPSSLRRPARPPPRPLRRSASRALSLSATRSFSRSSRPRMRLRARPSGPRIQRRSSAISRARQQARRNRNRRRRTDDGLRRRRSARAAPAGVSVVSSTPANPAPPGR